MSMYKRLEQALKDKGEIMLRTDSGQEKGLHLHNTEFIGEPIAKIESAHGTHWINLNKIESYWIHDEF